MVSVQSRDWSWRLSESAVLQLLKIAFSRPRAVFTAIVTTALLVEEFDPFGLSFTGRYEIFGRCQKKWGAALKIAIKV